MTHLAVRFIKLSGFKIYNGVTFITFLKVILIYLLLNNLFFRIN